MSDLRWEVYAENMQEQMLDEIYKELPKLYEGKDHDDIVKNVMKYVEKTYDDWEKFIDPEKIDELVREYAEGLN